MTPGGSSDIPDADFLQRFRLEQVQQGAAQRFTGPYGACVMCDREMGPMGFVQHGIAYGTLYCISYTALAADISPMRQRKWEQLRIARATKRPRFAAIIDFKEPSGGSADEYVRNKAPSTGTRTDLISGRIRIRSFGGCAKRRRCTTTSSTTSMRSVASAMSRARFTNRESFQLESRRCPRVHQGGHGNSQRHVHLGGPAFPHRAPQRSDARVHAEDG